MYNANEGQYRWTYLLHLVSTTVVKKKGPMGLNGHLIKTQRCERSIKCDGSCGILSCPVVSWCIVKKIKDKK